MILTTIHFHFSIAYERDYHFDTFDSDAPRRIEALLGDFNVQSKLRENGVAY